MSVFSDEPFGVIREAHHRGTYGKKGNGPFRWVPLCQMSDTWLQATIDYKLQRNQQDWALLLYYQERMYRAAHDIIMPD